MSLEGEKPERADKEKLDPILRSTISQEIRDHLPIGRIWSIR